MKTHADAGGANSPALRKRKAHLWLTVSAASLLYSGACFAQAVDGYGNPTPTTADTGSSYAFTGWGLSANPYLQQTPGDITAGGPLDFLNASPYGTGGEIRQSASGYSYTNATDSTDPAAVPELFVLEGNNASNATLTNEGNKSYFVLYKNFAAGAALTNLDGGSFYVESNNVDGVVINNDAAAMTINFNSALNGSITNVNGGQLLVHGNTIDGGTINNGADGETVVSRAVFLHNSAADITINTAGLSEVAFYGNDATNATLNLGAGTTTIVGDCSVALGCLDTRGTNLTNAAITNAGAFQVSGSVTAAGATLSNSGAMFISDATITGSWAITNTATGTFDFAGLNSVSADLVNDGAITVSAGQTQLHGGIAGAGTLAVLDGATLSIDMPSSYSGATQIDGTLLAAAGALSPNSVHLVSATGVLDTGAGAQTIGGLENAGVVRSTGAPGAVLTVAGNYVGAGGLVELDTVLGDENSVTDQLVILGDSTGQSRLSILNSGGLGALTNGDGIRVVSVSGSSTGVFTLAERVAAGAYEYRLYQNGVAAGAADGDWFLRSERPAEPDGPTGPFVPDYRAETPVYMAAPALASRFGLAMLGSWNDRTYAPLPGLAANGPTQTWCMERGKPIPCSTPAAMAQPQRVMAAWARVFGATGSVGDNGGGLFAQANRFRNNGPSYDYNMGGVQAGLDLYRNMTASGSENVFGLYVGAGRIEGKIDAVYGGRAGRVDLNGYSLGAYFTHKATNGWYVDAVLQGTNYQSEARSLFGQGMSSSGWGLAASLETGVALQLAPAWTLTPQAQLVYQTVSLDGGYDAFGRVAYSDTSEVHGRLGLRLAHHWTLASGAALESWGQVNVWHDFGAEAKTTLSNLYGLNPATLSTRLGGTVGQIQVGLSGRLADNVSAFVSGDYNVALADGDGSGWGGRVGFRVVW